MESQRERLDFFLDSDCVVALALAPMRRDALLMLEGAQIFRIRLDRELPRQQVVARVAGANFNHVAGPAEIGQVLIKYDLNVQSMSPKYRLTLARRRERERPPR